MTDLTKHAEAILRAARQAAYISRNQVAGLEDPQAILAAVQSLWDEAHDAGALAMRERAANFCEAEGACEQAGYGLNRAALNYFRARNGIRAIDPASLRSE